MENKYFIYSTFYRLAIVCILSAVGLSLGSFADVVIVGNAFNERGLAILNIAMPIYMSFNLISATIGVGSVVLISKNMGLMNFDDAKRNFTNTIKITVAIGICYSILASIFIVPIVHFLGGGDLLKASVIEYVKWLFIFAPFFIIGPVLNYLLRCDSGHNTATISAIVFVVVNIILDIIFIFGLKMGIMGAGLAICIAQLVAVLISLSHFYRKDIKLTIVKTKFEISCCLKIFANGIGVSSASLYQAIIVLVFNRLLLSYFDTSELAIYSVLFNVGYLALAFFQGLTFALVPIVGIYFGEKSVYSIKQTMQLTFRTAIVASMAVSFFLMVFPRQISIIFGMAYTDTFQKTLVIYAISIVFMGINVIMTSYFQVIRRNGLAFTVSLLRGMIFTLLFGLVFVVKYGAVGISITFLVAEVATTLFTWICLLITKKRENMDNIYLLRDRDSILPTYEIIFRDNLTNLQQFVQEIEEFCESNEIDMKKSYFINLFVEELAVKIFEKGFKNNKKGNCIMIKIKKNEDEVILRIRDNGINYNPFEDTEGTKEDMIGIDIVRGKALYFDYQRLFSFNNLYIIL